MTLRDILITIFEIILVCATLWCLFHEDKLISFEEGIKARFRRRRFKIVNSNRELSAARGRY